jgi:hypothetical protein
VECSCEYGKEPSGSINFWEVLEWLHKLVVSQIMLRAIELVTKE